MVALPDDIDSDYAIVELVKSLHDAKKLAIQQNDTKVMMDIVAGWFELHDRFVAAEEDEERQERSFGFSSTKEYEVTEAVSEHEHVPFADDEIEQEEEIDDPEQQP